MRWLLFPTLCLAVYVGRAQSAPTPLLTPEAATLVGTYRLTYRPDSTNPAPRSEIMYLLLGKALSQFHSQGEQVSDSLLVEAANIPFSQESTDVLWQKFLASPHSRFHYTIYKTMAPRRVYCYDKIGFQHYRYEEPTDAFNWTITPATATVAGYACQRATTTFGGRQWEAWFTREVPVSDGPYKFYGLPGLIMKVGDTRGYYVFELLKLAKPATGRRIAAPARAAASTDKVTFRRARADYDADPLGNMDPARNGGAGVIARDPATANQKVRENARKRNNPLELN